MNLNVVGEVLGWIDNTCCTDQSEDSEWNGGEPGDSEGVGVSIPRSSYKCIIRGGGDLREFCILAWDTENGKTSSFNQFWDKSAVGDVVLRSSQSHPLRNLLRRGLCKDVVEDDATYTATQTSECSNQTNGNSQVALRDIERGRGVAIQSDPTKGKHGQELHSHQPVQIVWRNKSGKSEEKCLHKDSKGELEVDVLNIVDKSGDDDASDKLASSGGIC